MLRYESTMYIGDGSVDSDISSLIVHITEGDECYRTTSEIDIIVDDDISTDNYDSSLGFSMDTPSSKYVTSRYSKILIFYYQYIRIVIGIWVSWVLVSIS